jgi:hypothetical protein
MKLTLFYQSSLARMFLSIRKDKTSPVENCGEALTGKFHLVPFLAVFKFPNPNKCLVFHFFFGYVPSAISTGHIFSPVFCPLREANAE